MDILVTGGAGFIGSFIVDELIHRGHTVTIFDSLDRQVHPEGHVPDYLNPHARFIHGNVRDYDALRSVVGNAEIIFHKAAMVGVGQSQYEIARYVEANTMGTANLLDILANHPHRVRKLIVAASMSSYGEGQYRCNRCGDIRPPLRIEEQVAQGDWELHCPQCDDRLAPVPTPEEAVQYCNSIYAFTKRHQEEMCLNIGRTYEIPTVALRYFNVYGPRQALSNPYTGVMAIFLSRLKNDNPPVIYEDGLQTRDFVSVHDIVQANMLAMDRDEADYDVFNVGGGQVLTIRSIAESIAQVLGKDIVPEITRKFRKGDVRHCFSDIRKIQATLGYTPGVSLEAGIRELIDWSRGVTAEDRFDDAAAELRAKGLV